MLVAAYLSPPLLGHLRIVLRVEHELLVAEQWSEMEALVRQRPVDVAVVDPSIGGSAPVEEIGRFRERFPSLPLVVYTTLAPASMRSLVELASIGITQAVLHRFDDAPAKFLSVLDRQRQSPLGALLIQRLRVPLAALSPALTRTIEQMYLLSLDIRSTSELARAASVSPRSLYRQLQGAGIASPRLLLATARMLRAYTCMRDPGYLLTEVSIKIGYSTPWQFTQETRALTGLTPRAVRRALGADELIDRLSVRLLTPDS